MFLADNWYELYESDATQGSRLSRPDSLSISTAEKKNIFEAMDFFMKYKKVSLFYLYSRIVNEKWKLILIVKCC